MKIPRQIFYAILGTLILLLIESLGLVLSVGAAIAATGTSTWVGLWSVWNPRNWS